MPSHAGARPKRWGCGCALLAVVLVAVSNGSVPTPSHYGLIPPGVAEADVVGQAARIAPTPVQLAWQEREFIAFAHFGMNTFTDVEWGTGREDPARFNPTDFDARQWARVLRDTGMRLLILTAKHHDGFCLWPTDTTTHSVRSSPWRGGRGDVVGEVAAACREAGLAFGIYVSPWDRHEPSYGDSPRYNAFFRAQLRELLSRYGEIAEVWFDGACGEGPDGRRQTYDWPSYYAVVRELQPQAVIFGMGPDVRWVGTETGVGRETEWSVIPDRLDLGRLAGATAHPVDAAFIPGDLTDADLGSRARLRTAASLLWYPAEADVSIRPGWFFHPAENSRVKTPAELLDIYFSSVGRNAVLLVNVPPDRRGRIHDADIRSLHRLRRLLDDTFRDNRLAGAFASAPAAPGHGAANVLDADPATYWSPSEDATSTVLEFELTEARTFDVAMVREHIRLGQRVEAFRLEWRNDRGAWREFARGATVGYQRLLRFAPVRARTVRLVIESSRARPAISAVGLFTLAK
ncbi:MAG TPA: alpha-L-fucosidase [Acidobacteriota bacterium]|nr:alpha-L-fucosidase [Acidobacteriota bacterium]HQF86741.1 alpha-L-fucosidase [Acidobacteriota bacterium]HQG91461.1 alpha-L-fucosidase [Acidobacteriota bacterium]